ncbi:LbetaH domain-containing protein [Roseiconus lacunae]|uniref:Acyltransferase n=1 Tax=Roseiconus lacunae TaxID=2605694 RepID=A0ABT7PR05_9BACT|nr:acyltransferase [Roseiconus lacunae]MCD0460337.1 hypothetical protein [Roseiconus lacunae]MDM4018939.1 hypothetical protein [Roseiconus lacunae]WRQ51838.1 hypothetical protein U8335_04695 [Stieleria sp. HD01]
MGLLTYLVANRCRPRFGSYQWLRYWVKRIRLSRELVVQVLRQARFARRCDSFGKRNALSSMSVSGSMKRLSIGNDCALGKINIQLHNHVTIGNAVVANDGVHIITGSHDIHDGTWPLISNPVVVEDYAWLATGSVVLPGVTVGRGAVVGAFAVVAKSIPPLAIAVGNPARVVGYRKVSEFEYRPNRLYALFEAWIGPQQRKETTASPPTAIEGVCLGSNPLAESHSHLHS